MPLSKHRNKVRMRLIRLHNKETEVPVQPEVSIYNPSIHKAGDTVLVYRGKRLVETTIPELDGDGNPVPEF